MADEARRVAGGVDTHKDMHVAAAFDKVGRVMGIAAFPTTPARPAATSTPGGGCGRTHRGRHVL